VWHGRGDNAELDRYDRQRRLVTLETIQTQTIQNKKNLENPEPFATSLEQIKADPKRTYDYLLRVSMIATLRRAAELG
jgi:3-(3-hydroxy-phenyl)propionate hydroxylase